ncbi:hypothetical protein DVK05_09860 [Halorubrum sp. Atlit-8R]|uniref:hypothetical protein n=1 Tax=Halorubrum sp. Atlit-8R TaxID=2282126 RepID=UPI000EF2005D|nr:hypothetical protein [Halorubrum sp. Atlit-8R]RLM81292.1 hypothetical protein DVK05_09860 [Halorubrum sp. Atlit-8R]
MGLKRSFKDELREATLDDIEETVRDEIGPQLMEAARENWKAYASQNDYDIDHIWEDAEGPHIGRDGDSITIRIEWPGLTALFEWGVDPHTIEGNPILSFYWKSPPEGTRPPGAPAHVETDSVNWGSVTGGIDESRAIRDAMSDLRQVMP